MRQLFLLALMSACLAALPRQGAKKRPQRPTAGAARMLRLPAGEARRNGVRWQRLQRTTLRGRRQALGLVLSAEPLVVLRERYVAAETKYQQDLAGLDYARQEHTRLQRLYQQRQNVSLKALQHSELALKSASIAAHADGMARALIAAETRQEWGPRVTRWLATPGETFSRLLKLDDYLVELTLPPGMAPPRMARLHTPGAAKAADITARLISIYPQINPRLQAPGYLYIAPARGLAPGLSLSAELYAGERRTGVKLPGSALLYWRGGAWIFLRLAPGAYRLTRLKGAQAMAGGFLPQPRMAGQAAVIAGAQQLFSQYQRQHSGQAPPGDD